MWQGFPSVAWVAWGCFSVVKSSKSGAQWARGARTTPPGGTGTGRYQFQSNVGKPGGDFPRVGGYTDTLFRPIHRHLRAGLRPVWPLPALPCLEQRSAKGTPEVVGGAWAVEV